LAATNLPGPAGSPTLGCANLVTYANGKIDDTNDNESILAWHQLARAGFLIGNYDGLGTVSSATNAPTNPFGGYLQLIFDNVYSDVAAPAPALNIKTGGNIPSRSLQNWIGSLMTASRRPAHSDSVRSMDQPPAASRVHL
jgi:hypothetical protein